MSDTISFLPYVKNAVGLDVMNILVNDTRRVLRLDGQYLLSCVDLMEKFGEDNRKANKRKTPFNPRGYWNDQKKALQVKDRELSDSIRQLKLPSSDGKSYKTDVAPLWACVFIVLLLDTPKAIEFKKSMAKGAAGIMERTIDDVKYRALNIAHGLEWAADTNHAQLSDNNLLHLDPNDDVWKDEKGR